MKRKFLFVITSIGVGLLISVLLLEIIFQVLPVRDSYRPLNVDQDNPVIRFEENRDVIWSADWDFSIRTNKHVNNYGFLNDQDYEPNGDKPLMAIIGDSYVEASQVANKDSLSGFLASELDGQGRVYSFGASGSPLSTYLAYAEYAKKHFRPDAMVFVIVGNDFDESLLKYKAAPGFHYFDFDGSSNNLKLVRINYQPVLIATLSRHSALVRYLAFNLKISTGRFRDMFDNRASTPEDFVGNTRIDNGKERIHDSISVSEAFLKMLPMKSGLSINKITFVVDGMRPHLYSHENLKQAENSYYDLMRNHFISSATAQGYNVIDMQPVFIGHFQQYNQKFEFVSDGHWNELGHSVAATEILKSSAMSAFIDTRK